MDINDELESLYAQAEIYRQQVEVFEGRDAWLVDMLEEARAALETVASDDLAELRHGSWVAVKSTLARLVADGTVKCKACDRALSPFAKAVGDDCWACRKKS